VANSDLTRYKKYVDFEDISALPAPTNDGALYYASNTFRLNNKISVTGAISGSALSSSGEVRVGGDMVVQDAITTNGQYAHISAQGANGQIYTMGQYGRIRTYGSDAYIRTTGQNASIYTAGSDANIYTQGSNAKIYTSGSDAWIETHGYEAEIRTNGQYAHISAQGANGQIYTMGQYGRIRTYGSDAYIRTTGQNASIYTAGSDASIYTQGSNAYISSSHDIYAKDDIEVGGAISVGKNAAPDNGYAIDVATGAGSVRADEFVTYSDRALKTNIQKMNNCLEKVMKLEPTTYDKVATGKSEIGFIAQDVAKIVPEICALDTNGEGRGIDYSRMSTLLVGALKAQQEQIEQLKEIINKLQK